MNNKLLFSAILVMALLQLKAQTFERYNYDWESKPKAYTLTKEESELPQFDILDKRSIELVNEANQAFIYQLRHSKRVVNSDEAIERNNKIYIPYKSTTNFITNKIRVIKPNGVIIEISDSDIKEATDEKTQTNYRYYALRGLEKGSVIEQLSVKKKVPDLSGITETFQDNYTTKLVDYEIIYPEHLIFEIRSYNGFPDLETDTTIEEKIRKYVLVNNIPGVEDEEYSNEVKHLQRMSYKLTGNKVTRKFNLNGFSTFTQNSYNAYQSELSKADIKALDKFFKKSGVQSLPDNEQKIKAIENFLKANIQYDKGASQPLDISTTIAAKVASVSGTARLFYGAYMYFNIDAQVVITSDRFSEPFDPKFESYDQLENLMLYFPKYKKYMAPTEYMYRYPLFPHRWGYNYGLFIKSTELGGVKMGMSDKKFIELPGDDVTRDTMQIEIDLSKNQFNPDLKYRLTFEGHTAVQFQPIFDLLDNDQKKEFKLGLAQNYVSNKDKFEVTSENEGTEFLGLKPFAISFSVKGEKLTEKAGNTLLFKIGETIGRQQELYQKGQRKLPVELAYPHAYIRTIKLILPDNYTVSNLKDLKINFSTTHEGKEACGFHSDYMQKDNVVTISNTEFYKETALPIEVYKSFESVINAAADFNKIVLVLEPK